MAGIEPSWLSKGMLHKISEKWLKPPYSKVANRETKERLKLIISDQREKKIHKRWTNIVYGVSIKTWQTWEGGVALDAKSSALYWLIGQTSSNSNRSSRNTKAYRRGKTERKGERGREQHISSAGCFLQLVSAGFWPQLACFATTLVCTMLCARHSCMCRSGWFWSSFKGRLHSRLLAWGHFCTGHVTGWS